VHDPEAIPNVRALYGDKLTYCDRPYGAIESGRTGHCHGVARVSPARFRSHAPPHARSRHLRRSKSLRAEERQGLRVHLLRDRTVISAALGGEREDASSGQCLRSLRRGVASSTSSSSLRASSIATPPRTSNIPASSTS